MVKKIVSIMQYLVFIGSVVAAVIYYMYYYRNQKKSEEVFLKMEQEVNEQQDDLHKEAQRQIRNYKNNRKSRQKSKRAGTKPNLSILELKKMNQDIYGWIDIPGTVIQYPVLQHEKDNYYLLHNINGSTGYPGCIYSNKINRKTFTDEITVLYGHNMKNGTMFGSLHDFKDSEFFNENPFVYIYTQHKVCVYQIFAVKKWGDSALLETYNPASVEDKNEFLRLITKENTIQYRAIRDKKERKVLVLSTCIRGNKQNRLLVIGVLV